MVNYRHNTFYKVSDIYSQLVRCSNSKEVRSVVEPRDLTKIGVFLYCNSFGVKALGKHFGKPLNVSSLTAYDRKGKACVVPDKVQKVAINVTQAAAKEAFIQLVKHEGSRTADAAKAVGDARRDYYRYTMRGIYKQYSAKVKVDICQEAELNSISTLDYVCSLGKMIELLQFAKTVVG